VSGATPAEAPALRRDLLVAAGARTLVQFAGNLLSLYLLYYFESVSSAPAPATLAAEVGRVLTLAYLLPLPIALALGRLSDRIGRRTPILVGAAVLAALGLLGMALAGDRTPGAIGFCAYAVGSQVFVNLHAAFAMQLLPDPAHRGRDLGLFNLANTLPAVAGPCLAWLLAAPHDFAPLMLALAVLTLSGGLAMLMVRGRR
jgi:MFS family permease